MCSFINHVVNTDTTFHNGVLSFLTGIIHISKKKKCVLHLLYQNFSVCSQLIELGLSVNITDCLAKKVKRVWSKTSMKWEMEDGGGQYIYITTQFKFSVCIPVIIFNTAWRNLCNFQSVTMLHVWWRFLLCFPPLGGPNIISFNNCRQKVFYVCYILSLNKMKVLHFR